MRSLGIGSLVTAVLLVGCSSPASTGSQKSGVLPQCPADPTQRTEPCIDEVGLAICPTKTGYPGDGLAVCEPEAGKGMLVHYGPTDYDDPAQMEAFMLAPNTEDENCTYVRTPNADKTFVDSYSGRMRPHSHHLIVTMLQEAGFQENPLPAKCNLLDVVGARWLVGSQEPQIDISVAGAKAGAPEARVTDPNAPDYELAQVVPAKTPLRVDLHYVNTTDQPLLREAWIQLSETDEAHAKTIVDMITFFQGKIDVPPDGDFTTVRAKCVANSDRYLGLVTGHAHSRMTRESVWHDKADGTSDLVYETYDWSEPGELFYRDGLQNPVANSTTKAFGGASGYQLVKKGESVSFECEYHNPTSTEIKLGETTKTEMCNVFGMYYPTDGDVWSCACANSVCLDKIPAGVNPFAQ